MTKLMTQWIEVEKVNSNIDEVIIAGEYKVTIVQVKKRRDTAWLDYMNTGMNSDLRQGIMALVFGISSRITIYSAGRLVGVSWAGSGLFNQTRVANRIIEKDLKLSLIKSAVTNSTAVYAIKANLSN